MTHLKWYVDIGNLKDGEYAKDYNDIIDRAVKRVNEWKKGDKGYIDGYIVVDGTPYAVVINLRTKRPVSTYLGGTIEVIEKELV